LRRKRRRRTLQSLERFRSLALKSSRCSKNKFSEQNTWSP
jgi:hypothetical protein